MAAVKAALERRKAAAKRGAGKIARMPKPQGVRLPLVGLKGLRAIGRTTGTPIPAFLPISIPYRGKFMNLLKSGAPESKVTSELGELTKTAIRELDGRKKHFEARLESAKTQKQKETIRRWIEIINNDLKFLQG